MNSRYLFRDGELIDVGDIMRTFDEISKKGDLLLCANKFGSDKPITWLAYRMSWYGDSWGWHAMPPETAKELQVLLLLQKSSELLNTSQPIY